MSEHLTQIHIEKYGRQGLTADEFLFVSRHMQDCESCRLKIEGLLDEAFYALRTELLVAESESILESSHLNFELTSAYIEDTLAADKRRVIKDHLAACEKCAAEVDDLREFRNHIAPGLDIEFSPSIIQRKNGNLWNRFFKATRDILPRSPALIVYSGLAALLIIASSLAVLHKLEGERFEKAGLPIALSTQQTTAMGSLPDSRTKATEAMTVARLNEAMIVARLNDGAGQVALDGEGKVSGIANLTPQYQRMIQKAISSRRFEKSPFLADLSVESVSLRGGESQEKGFSVIEPRSVVLLSDHPTFRWTPLSGATAYIVEVYDDQSNLVISSPRGTDTSWTAQDSLKRGRTYSWQVRAFKDDVQVTSPRPPEAVAKFRILSQAMANEIDRDGRAYASSHLILALIYNRAGLLEKAEQELRKLQKANPDSKLPRRFLSSLQEMRVN